ncbi:MAG: Ig-like domain-containing protein [Lachnospiraceae bacterium]|nr:Ig-like domain-containing protein [Candidatus Colinaster equi]
MKKILKTIALLIVFACALAIPRVSAEASILDTSFVKMNVGETYTIAIDGVDNSDLEFSTKNPLIASVDENGIITANKSGSVFVIARASSHSYYYRVTVYAPTIKLNKTSSLIYIGGNCVDNVQLRANVKGARTNVLWETSNAEVAVVSEVGRVTSVGEGTAEITASANGVNITCKVTVVDVTTVLDRAKANIVTKGNGNSIKLNCSVTGASKTIVWKSSDPTVATVDKTGKVTGKKTGQSIITATCNGILDTCIVNVTTTTLKFPIDIINKPVNPYEMPTYTIVPVCSGLTEKIVFTSSNPKVASIDSNGKITFLTGGSTTITAKANGLTVSHKFKVNKPTISIDKEKVDVFTKYSVSLKASLVGDIKEANFIAAPGKKTQEGVGNKDVKIADIDKFSGKITGIESGFCYVYAYIPGLVTEEQISRMQATGEYFPDEINKNYYKKCYVTVYKSPTVSIRDPYIKNESGINITLSDIELTQDYYEKTRQLMAYIVGPSDKHTWKSSDTKIATVDKNGLVTARKTGECNIILSANDVVTQCHVNVIASIANSSDESKRNTKPKTSINYDSKIMLPLDENNSVKTVIFNKAVKACKLSAIAKGPSNKVKWRVDNDPGNLIKVDSNGNVRMTSSKLPIGSYTATVVAYANEDVPSKDKNYQDTVRIIVTNNTLNLDVKQLTLNLHDDGTSYMFNPTIGGEPGTGVTYLSSNPKIASVNDEGVVCALKAGKTTITACLNGVKATCPVTVLNNSLVIKDKPKTIYYGGTATSECTITANVVGAQKDVKWSSSDTSVAIVSADSKKPSVCNVHSQNVGEVVITATCNGLSTTIPVYVKETSIALDKEEINLNTSTKGLDYYYNLKATVVGSSSKVIWESDDTEVAKVDKNGKVTGISTGTCYVYATANGLSCKCKVNVTTTSLALEENELSVYAYDYPDGYQITAHATGLSSDIVWTSSDKKVVTVDNEGRVCFVGHGKAKITASSSGVKDVCTVIVNRPVTALNTENVTLYYGTNVGNTSTLKATVVGNAKGVIWESDNPDVVSVQNGKLVAVAPGTATVTAEANDIPASCTVDVYETNFNINTDTLILTKDYYCHTGQLSVTDIVGVNNATKWATTNAKVASVSNSGLVTAKGIGDCIIKVTINGLEKCVNVHVDETSMDTPTISLNKNNVLLVANSKTQKTYKLVATVSGHEEKVTWSSSDTTVVKVDSKGTVTAIKEGTARVTAMANGVSAVCDVEVTQNKVVLDKTALKLNAAGTNMNDKITVQSISGTVEDGTPIIWTTSNSKIAEVDDDGNVVACGAGNCNIVASVNGVSATCKVTVINNTITLNRTTLDFDLANATSKKASLTAKVVGVNSAVSWESNNESVATVSVSGVVTAMANGGCTITATANGITAVCDISVFGGNPAPHEHVWTKTIVSDPTCTEKGHCINVCKKCGKREEADIEATGHRFTSKIVAPTHSSEGYTLNTCYCGYETRSDVVARLSHDYNNHSEVVKPATCFEEGQKRCYCECGEYITESIDKIEHTESTDYVVTKIPTETEGGTKQKYCLVCAELLGDVEDIEPLSNHDHSWVVDEYVPATSDAEGYFKFVCRDCDATDIETIDPETEYDFKVVEGEGTASNCHFYSTTKKKDELSGRELYFIESTDRAAVFNPNNHVDCNGISGVGQYVIKPATYKEEGTKRELCRFCSYDKNEKIDKLTGCEHDNAVYYIESGKYKTKICLVCNTVLDKEELETCAHCEYSVTQEVAKEATPTEDGEVDFVCSTCGCIKDRVVIHAHDKYEVNIGEGRSAIVRGYYDTAKANELLDAVNEYRIDNNALPLAVDSKLSDAAGVRAYEIAYLYSHNRPCGEEWSSVERNTMMAENMVVCSSDDIGDVLDVILSCEVQKDNIQNAKYKSVGIKVFNKLEFPDNGYDFVPKTKTYYIIEFGA